VDRLVPLAVYPWSGRSLGSVFMPAGWSIGYTWEQDGSTPPIRGTDAITRNQTFFVFSPACRQAYTWVVTATNHQTGVSLAPRTIKAVVLE